MSNETEALVRRAFAADTRLIARGAEDDPSSDEAILRDAYADDIVYESKVQVVGAPGCIQGADAVIAFSRDDIHDTWRGGFEVAIDDVIAKGDLVLVLYTERARTGRSYAPPVEFKGAADLYRVRNGRIVAITTFESHEQALEAAGLSE